MPRLYSLKVKDPLKTSHIEQQTTKHPGGDHRAAPGDLLGTTDTRQPHERADDVHIVATSQEAMRKKHPAL